MDNKDIIARLSQSLGRNKNDVSKLLDAFTATVKERCSELDTIAVPGFGSFEAKKKNERVVVNPGTGKRMLVPPKITVNFKVSNVLKNKLK